MSSSRRCTCYTGRSALSPTRRCVNAVRQCVKAVRQCVIVNSLRFSRHAHTPRGIVHARGGPSGAVCKCRGAPRRASVWAITGSSPVRGYGTAVMAPRLWIRGYGSANMVALLQQCSGHPNIAPASQTHTCQRRHCKRPGCRNQHCTSPETRCCPSHTAPGVLAPLLRGRRCLSHTADV
jgi:hypothetical protein